MPRGTSAVDYRAHNPKDGGSIPSPATKHGVFMIAIDITEGSDSDTSLVTNTEFQAAPEPLEMLEVGQNLLSQHSKQIYDLLKNCIDQQFILNTVWMGVANDSSKQVARYFATTPENAQAFLNVFLDMSADFSIKKMWSQIGVHIVANQYEIDFDLVEDNFDLISEDGKIWGVKH